MSYSIFSEQEAIGRAVAGRGHREKRETAHLSVPDAEEGGVGPQLQDLHVADVSGSQSESKRGDLVDIRLAGRVGGVLSDEDIHARQSAYTWMQETPGQAFSTQLDISKYFKHPYVLERFHLESKIRRHVERFVYGAGGLAAKYGFDVNPNGGASCAVNALVYDLLGDAGALDLESSIHSLHADIFANYNIWAAHIGGSLVRSYAHRERSDIDEKFADLCLWYLIRTEAANLRYCPELLCWIHHQMRVERHYIPPPPSRSAITTEAGVLLLQPSFFFVTTITPLYDLLKAAAPSKTKVPDRKFRRWCWFTSTPNADHPISNSHRANYDDLNERFWNPDVLNFAYHTQTQNGVHTIRLVTKTFKEHANYLALFLNFFPWWLFLAVLFHGLLGLGNAIASRGGRGVADLGLVPASVAIESLSIFLLTLAAGKVLHVVLVLLFRRASLLSINTIATLCYHAAWATAIYVVYFVDGLGTGLWWAVFSVRLLFVAIGNGFFHPIFRASWLASLLETYISDMEKVYTGVPRGGVLGGNLLRQSFWPVVFYTLIWIFLLACKIIFDLHVITQNAYSTTQITDLTLEYSWGGTTSGAGNVWINIGLWITVALLFCIDSYIAYSVAMPIIGTVIAWHDGLGRIRTWSDVLKCFSSFGEHSRKHKNCLSTTRQFSSKFFPAAGPLEEMMASLDAQNLPQDARIWVEEAKAHVSPPQLFGTTWNLMIKALRSEDLLSNYEMSMMTFGKGWHNIPQWPLWCVQGRAHTFLTYMPAVMSLHQGRVADWKTLYAKIRTVDNLSTDAAWEFALSLKFVLAYACALHPNWNAAMEARSHQLLARMEEAFINSLMVIEQGLSPDALVFARDIVDCIHSLTLHMLDTEQSLTSTNGGTEHVIFTQTAATLHKMGLFLSQLRQCDESLIDSIAEITAALKTQYTYTGTISEALERIGLRHEYEMMMPQVYRLHVICAPKAAVFEPRVKEAERRIAFWMNSIFMRELPTVDNCLEMSSFSALTPHYAEAVIYDHETFLTKVNEQGVSPLIYLQSLHPHEWRNFRERIGAGPEQETWQIFRDALGLPVDGVLETRLWASMRGQTLARTVTGTMEYPAAYRFRLFHELHMWGIKMGLEQMRAGEGAILHPHGHLMLSAAISAEWLTTKKIQYVCCCQKYGDMAPDDRARRTDIDILLRKYPLLRVAYFEASQDASTNTKAYTSVCVAATSSREIQPVYRIRMPGHPIIDGLGEGKPENQNAGAIYCTGRVVQVLDMNQAGYFEEALKLPHVLDEFRRTSHWQRPVALVGTREHVFTQELSTPALFMSYQELQFGVVWQRVMHTPLRVRLHYGHPDFVNKVFMSARGGYAKASRTVNVSEDVFAGLNAMLRGGESKHIEYMQMGKGRDIGMLQISQFEAKVSGGSAISLTTRDAVRAFNNLEFFRMISLWHTWAGYYVTNVIVALATAYFLYFYGILAIAGIDGSIFSSSSDVRLVGSVLIINWIAQLGGLFLIPIFFFLLLELGIVRALWQSFHMLFTLGPLFYVAEMQTKAYYFDQAISFGRQVYLATGRDFVIRHVQFVETYRAFAHSHLYFGTELLFIMILIFVYGNFEGVVAYVFFFAASWVYILSLLLIVFWFNPFALELQAVTQDFKAWWKWLFSRAESAASAHRVWLNESVANYRVCPTWTRIYHAVRLLRFPAICTALLYRTSISRVSNLSEAIAVPAMILLPLAAICLLEVSGRCRRHYMMKHNAQQQANATTTATTTTATTAPSTPAHKGQTIVMIVLAVLALVIPIAGLILLVVFGADAGGSGSDIVLLLVIFFVMLWYWSRTVVVVNAGSIVAGALMAATLFDAFLGAFLLLIQTVFAAIPYGATSHNALLFAPRYARTLEMVLGSKSNR